MESSGGIDPRANRGCASDCMDGETERDRESCCSVSSEEEEEEEEEEKPKQMQGARGYWSSSRGESTVGGSLLSLYVTDQEEKTQAYSYCNKACISNCILSPQTSFQTLIKLAFGNWVLN